MTVKANDRPLFFVTDLLGHYVTVVACKVGKEKLLLLVDSTKNKYINSDVLDAIAKMCF